MAFDLISDLHAESWGNFDWQHQATSPMCIVAGDVARDHNVLQQCLKNLGENYQAVLYIDGNEEHRDGFEHLGESYKKLHRAIEGIPNVTYMQDQVVIIRGCAFIATNAWWTFDYTDRYSEEQSRLGVENYYGLTRSATDLMQMQALSDVKYLENSLRRLQTYPDVRNIVITTHTVPRGEFVEGDPDISDCYRINASTNSYINNILKHDSENKVRAWCFGHYHVAVDQVVDTVRYVCNPRGRNGTKWCRSPYFPIRIEI